MKNGQLDCEGRIKEVLEIAQQIERLTQDTDSQKEKNRSDNK